MQLLQHFKELTIRPKNAEELKGLILQLAIQGKLTANWREENTDIEPASELLKRIQKEKEELVKSKKLKKEKTFPILDSKPFLNLPINWECSYLGDLGYAQTGTTPPTKNPDNYGSFIPFLGPANISNSSMEYPIEGLSEEGLKKGRLIEANSLMMVCIGGSMGKCNVNTKDVSCNQQINVLTTIYSPIEYIKIVCQSPYFQKEVWDRSTGSATPMINKNKWLQIPISVPPLEEQKEIVNVVETLFKEVEQLEQLTVQRVGLKEDFVTSALHQLTTNNVKQEWTFLQDHFKSFFNETTNIKKLRETVLQLAVQGKLTADWRQQQSQSGAEVEDASQLLKRIQEEKAQLIATKKIKKEKALPLITKDEIPYELPDGWVWCRLGDILLSTDAGKSPSCEKRPVEKDEWGVLTTTSIQKGYFLQDENKVLPSSFEINHSMVVQEGDILITRAGPLNRTGIVCRVNDLSYNLILSDKTVRLKHFVDNVNGDFLVVILNSSIIRKILVEMMSGMASSQVNISQGNIKSSMISLPPLEEQKVIVEKVNSLMGLCDGLEQEVQQSQAHSEQLMQSVLREVFEGERKAVEV